MIHWKAAVWTALMWLGTMTCAVGSAADAPRPNFFWLVAEDTGTSAYSCYEEQKAARTPNLDRLGTEGMRFTRFYTTAPVCSPSRSAFMTGMFATSIDAHNHRSHRSPAENPLPSGVRVFTQWLQDAGYFTANLRELPAGVGFKGTGKTDWNFTPSGKPFDSAKWSDLKSHQPFFAQINFHETHRAYNGEYLTDPASVELPPYYPDHQVTRADYARYLDAAKELDRKVGLILQHLQQDGLADNTVVLFMGDNGESHVRGKQFCYEEGLRVPLLVRWPAGIPAPRHYRPGSVDDRLLMAIDVAPTMLSLAGADVPQKMQGAPIFGERAGEPRQYVFGARDRCDMTIIRLRTVRDQRYRYIRNFTPHTPFLARNQYKEKSYPVWNLLQELQAEGKLTPVQEVLCAPTMPAEELYDLESDPHQVRNLAGSPEHRGTLERFRNVLEQWMETTNDRGRRMETLEEVQAAEARFDPALDWHPEK